MANKLQCVVITPERQVVDSPADSVVIPAHDGEVGILPSRAPLMCELGVGELRVTQAGKTQRLLLDGGFAQVADNRVIVLTQAAWQSTDLNRDVISAEEKQLAALPGDDPARARSQRRLAQMRRILG